MGRGKKLTKNTIIIAIGKISTQFISFVLLPFYTAILSTKEYGIVDLVNTIAQLSIPLVSLMIEQAAFRHLLDCKNEKSKVEVVSSSFHILNMMTLLFILFSLVISYFYTGDYLIYVVLIIIVTSYNNLLLQIARGMDNTKLYAIGSFICSSTIIVFNVLLLAVFKLGIVGMLLATLVGNLVSFIVLAIKLRVSNYYSRKSINKKMSKELINYSLPLIPNNISLWIMNSSDKFIVSLFLGVSMNGILAISHKFPAIYMTIFGIFLLAWQEFVAIHFFDKDRDEYLSKMINKILNLFTWFAISLIIMIPIVFNIFINKNYNESFYNIPIYMLAFIFNVVIGLLGAVYVANKKTIEIVKTTTIAAVINIISNLALINLIGLYAASISTLMGYFIAMIYRIYDTQKYMNIKYDIKKLVVLFLILVFSCILYYMNLKFVSLLIIPVFAIAFLLSEKRIIIDIYNTFLKRGIKNEKKQEIS